ncbi:MAG: addiction module antidote protein, HigA family [Gammaproteobacteria bacterium]|nr:MAG: addiction module antidote protein, HigA family [Gammaproteobacteria bacterium]
MTMYNPPAPGEFIREICLEPLGLTVTQAAKDLGVSRKALSELLNGKAGISPEMALRLAKAFNTTPESWLTQQMHYDLWQAKQKAKSLHVRKLWVGSQSVSR